MPLSLKPGVKLAGLQPQILLAAVVASEVYSEHGVQLCVITSANDGNHSHTSLHYSGNAIDLRTRNLPPGAAPEIAKIIKERLGRDFDVLFEGDHIHIEYQPRRAT